jgi:uridine kinase
METRFVVGIGGGTGSGKTTLSLSLQVALGPGTAAIVPHDAYYRDLSELPPAERARVNFDDPASLETDRLVSDVEKLRRGESILVPVYDFATHTRAPGGTPLAPVPVLILEGILVLADEGLRACTDLKVFVEADADVRLARRIRRDAAERGRDLASVLAQYERTVRPMHAKYVEPSRAHADLVVPGEADAGAAVEVIAAHVKEQIRDQG